MSTSLLPANLLRRFGAVAVSALLVVSFQTAAMAATDPFKPVNDELALQSPPSTVVTAGTAALYEAVTSAINKSANKASATNTATWVTAILGARSTDNNDIADDLVGLVVTDLKALIAVNPKAKALTSDNIAAIAASALVNGAGTSGDTVGRDVAAKAYALAGDTVSRTTITKFAATIVNGAGNLDTAAGAFEAILRDGADKYPQVKVNKVLVTMTAADFTVALAKANAAKSGAIVGGLVRTQSDYPAQKAAALDAFGKIGVTSKTITNLLAGSLEQFGQSYDFLDAVLGLDAVKTGKASAVLANLNAAAKGVVLSAASVGDATLAANYIGHILDSAAFDTTGKNVVNLTAIATNAISGVNANADFITAVVGNVAAVTNILDEKTSIAASVIAKTSKTVQGAAAQSIASNLAGSLVGDDLTSAQFAVALAKAKGLSTFAGYIAAGVANNDLDKTGAITIAMISDTTLDKNLANIAAISGRVAAASASELTSDITKEIYGYYNTLKEDAATKAGGTDKKAAAAAAALVNMFNGKAVAVVSSLATSLANHTGDPADLARELGDSAMMMAATVAVPVKGTLSDKAFAGKMTAYHNSVYKFIDAALKVALPKTWSLQAKATFLEGIANNIYGAMQVLCDADTAAKLKAELIAQITKDLKYKVGTDAYNKFVNGLEAIDITKNREELNGMETPFKTW